MIPGTEDAEFGGEAEGLPDQEPHARGAGGRAQGEEEDLRGDHQGHRGDLQQSPQVYLRTRSKCSLGSLGASDLRKPSSKCS